MNCIHTNVFKHLYLPRTQSQANCLSAGIISNYTLGQRAIQTRAHLVPIRRTVEDRTASAQPGRHNSIRHVMNRTRESPSSKLEEWPRNQPPAENSQRSDRLPRIEHMPNTEQEEERVYVLTVKTTESLALPMNEFRERYFPRRLNRTPAHLTLFHALPHSQLIVLDQVLAQTSSNIGPFHISAGKPFRMRRGVGINVGQGYRTTKEVHERLRSQWLDFLSEQDAGGFRPHWTAMNKVNDEEKVDSAFKNIQTALMATSREGQALGLVLWNYNGGNWELAKEYLFGDAKRNSQTSG